MAYATVAQNIKADSTRAQIIAVYHKQDRTHYDTPGSVRTCACASCNATRRTYHVQPITWKN